MDVAAMLKEPGGARPAGTSADDFEWVNAWAARGAGRVAAREGLLPGAESGEASIHLLASAFAADAGRAAAALDRLPPPENSAPPAGSPPAAASRRTIFLRRTADRVPIILGSAIGALMLVVFMIAAMFVKFAR